MVYITVQQFTIMSEIIGQCLTVYYSMDWIVWKQQYTTDHYSVN